MEQQLADEVFRKYADRVIINDGTLGELKMQIDQIMGDYLWQE
jgi:dephospho-CoA kinase